MSSTEQRVTANRVNALKSTGPRTQDGKATVSQNATRHGLFSNRLFLEGENPAEFDTLQCELQASLNPVGAIELALVERIAINMWRQRRLVTAETAAINLSRERKKVTDAVNKELSLTYSSELDEDDIEPFDEVQADWCKAVMAEIDVLGEIDLGSLERLAPRVFKQLKSDAEDDHTDPAGYIAEVDGGLTAWVEELHSYCQKQLEEAQKRAYILAVAEQVRLMKLVLPSEALELFARYQTSLDNQVHKALKALREAQEWRLNTIDMTRNDTTSNDAIAA